MTPKEPLVAMKQSKYYEYYADEAIPSAEPWRIHGRLPLPPVRFRGGRNRRGEPTT